MFISKKVFFTLFIAVSLSLMLTNRLAFASPIEGYSFAGGSGYSVDQRAYQTRLSVYFPPAFEAWIEQYDSRPTQKAVYLALGVDDGWAAGMAYGRSTLSEAKSRALQICNDSRAQYSISDTCKLYAENSSIVYLNDYNPVAQPFPEPTSSSSNATISPNLEIYIPRILYQDPFSGTINLWLRFEFSHESNGQYYWILKSAGGN